MKRTKKNTFPYYAKGDLIRAIYIEDMVKIKETF